MVSESGLLLVAGVVLAAVLVGALVPALLQLRRTLRKAEETLEGTGSRLNRVLDELAITTSRINQLGPEFRDRKERVKELLDSIVDLSQPLRQARASLGRTVAMIGALGPAIAAAVKAFLAKEEPRVEPAERRAARPRGTQPVPAGKPSLSGTIQNAD